MSKDEQIADLTAERDALAARIEAARAYIEITHKAMPKGSRAEIRLASALAALSGATE